MSTEKKPQPEGEQTEAPKKMTKDAQKKLAMAAIACVAVVALCAADYWARSNRELAATPTPAAPTQAATPTPELTPQPTATPTPEPTPTPTPEPTPEPTPTPYDFAAPVPEREAVENDYFGDAVFIGDSRTDGLRLYSGIKDSNFLHHNGVTVFDVASRDSKVLEVDGEKVSFLDALSQREYAKIYIMLGINELGYHNNTSFYNVYGLLIDRVREVQPEAVIYIQSLIPVNEEKCREYHQPDYITNEKIEAYTELLVQLAEEKRVAYVDVAAALLDEDGLLPADLTNDGVHFKRAGYVQWLDYLKLHTVDETAYWAGQAAGETQGEGEDAP